MFATVYISIFFSSNFRLTKILKYYIATIANNVGLKPLVIRGGALKSINQMYNKELAKYKSIYARQGYMTSAPNSRTNSTPASTTNSNTAPVSTTNSDSTPTSPQKTTRLSGSRNYH